MEALSTRMKSSVVRCAAREEEVETRLRKWL